MKLRPLFVTTVVVTLFFVNPARGFTQTLDIRDIADDLGDFSDDMSGALPFLASIGLDWSDAYIGQLIDITPHWGIGIATGATTVKLDKLNVLLENFDYKADDGFADKQLLPAYVINTRIGGFRTMPFDIGVKWGWLPYIPIFKNNISYEAVVYGLDFRWEIIRDWGLVPAISMGFEASRATGGLRSKSAITLSPASGSVTTSGDATVGPVWEAWVFDAKLHIAKKFWEPRFTVFGGARLGVALTKTGYQIAGSGGDVKVTSGGSENNLEDWSDKSLNDFAKILEAESGSNMTFVATSESITGWIDKVGINLNLHGGIALNFYNGLKLDMTIMADIIHFELGAGIGIRYQQ
ncbi:MAG: hypothetical protein LBB47_06185 [Spirochaetaceae bacterium]|jgi:hypothetical protein|nr:hypothetical protein [Spirochaetaceae bacterium]